MERALQRFDAAHVLVNADGRFWYHPLAAPTDTDDSRDAEAMTFLRRVHNDLVRPTQKRKPDTSHG